MQRAVIEATSLLVRFHRQDNVPVVALDELDLSIQHGEFVAVLGASGAGKTTLLRCLTGFVRPEAGELIVDGTDAANATGRELLSLRQRVATIYQHFNLVERSSAHQNVILGRLGHISVLRGVLGLFPHEDKLLAWQALGGLGLEDRALQRVDQLSGGERQRVAIARALVQEPRIVLADEPAASLDVSLTRQVIETLQDLHAGLGLTVLVNMHDVDLARSFATRVIGLRAGRIVFDGPPVELTNRTLEFIYDESGVEGRAQPVRSQSRESSRPVPAQATT